MDAAAKRSDAQRVWNSARRRLRAGTVLQGGRYVIAEVGHDRAVVQRTRTGSEEILTRARLVWTWRQLLRGRALVRQASRPDGGISYTVAIVAAAAAALGRGITYDGDRRCFVAAS